MFLKLCFVLLIAGPSCNLVAGSEPKIIDIVKAQLEGFGDASYPPEAIDFLEEKIDNLPAEDAELLKEFIALQETKCEPANIERFRKIMFETKTSMTNYEEDDVFRSIVGFYAKQLDRHCYEAFFSKYNKGLVAKMVHGDKTFRIISFAEGVLTTRDGSFIFLEESFDLQKEFDSFLNQLEPINRDRDAITAFHIVYPYIKIDHHKHLKHLKLKKKRIERSKFEEAFKKYLVDDCNFYVGATGDSLDGLSDFMVAIPGDRRLLSYNWLTMMGYWAGIKVCKVLISKPHDELLDKIYQFYVERYG